MQYEIKHLHEKLGVTVYVTHDQTEALTMSDRVAVFNDGDSAITSPPNLYENPTMHLLLNSLVKITKLLHKLLM